MATQVLVKRGLSANLSGVTLSLGELAYTTDTKKLYVGDGAGGKVEINVDLPTMAEIMDALGTAATKDVGTAAGNVPVLDAGGKLDESVLPAIAITDVFEAANEAAMLALTAQTGDIAVRSDLNKSFILKAVPATTLANWVELKTPTDSVLSVNGKTGAVTLSAADVGLGNVDNTSDADKPISTATQAALDLKASQADVDLKASQTDVDLKAPLASPALTGVPTAPTAAASANDTQIATTAFVKEQNYIAEGGVIDGGTF